jgi:hypothetical protein
VAAVLGLFLAAGVTLAPPSAAHSFTKSDANDSPGRLDIKSATVRHDGTTIVHQLKTYERWKPSSLGNDSFAFVAIDTNFDDDFERCAFIFYAKRLRGSLTNCGRNFIRSLDVKKPSGTTASVAIPRGELGDAYRWVMFTYWTGAPQGCSDTCIDAAPNRPPPILHDLTGPDLSYETEPLRVWEGSTTGDFVFPFTVTDAFTDIASWSVQGRLAGDTTWTTLSTGSGEGSHDPSFSGVPPGQYEYRVIAVDGQGNTTEGPITPVYVPTDLDVDTGPGTSAGGVNHHDTDAYGESYVAFNELTDSYSIDVSTGGSCRRFELIGPGTGDWQVQITDGLNPIGLIAAADLADAPRQRLYGEELCGDATRAFIVIGGTDGSAGFGVDAVLI